MADDALQSFRDRIWFTFKSRMMAERRFKQYDRVFTILVSALSVLVIGMNLLALAFENSQGISLYTIFIAVFILMLSLIVYGFQFGKQATLHRECYLKLQRIHSELDDLELLKSQYHQIIDAYPNHSDHDYETFVVSQTLHKKRKLTDPSGDAVKWTHSMLGGQFLHVLLVWALPATLVAAFVAPLCWLVNW